MLFCFFKSSAEFTSIYIINENNNLSFLTSSTFFIGITIVAVEGLTGKIIQYQEICRHVKEVRERGGRRGRGGEEGEEEEGRKERRGEGRMERESWEKINKITLNLCNSVFMGVHVVQVLSNFSIESFTQKVGKG
jgi:hypothetical protein